MPNKIKRALSFLAVAALCAALITVPAASAFAEDTTSESAITVTGTETTPDAISEPATSEAAVEEQPAEAASEPEYQPIIPISGTIEAPIAISAPIPSEFADVTGHWAAADIEFVVRNGLFSGVGDGRFDPEGILTRGMLVTVLGRYDGVAALADAGTSFTDVAAGAYYTPYVAWASFNGIATGVGDSQFAPDAVITREQAAKILASYIRYSSKIPRSTRIYKPPFEDAASISDWALEDVNLLRSYGLIDGFPDGNFRPNASLTRAEAATLLKRFVENTPRSSHQTF